MRGNVIGFPDKTRREPKRWICPAPCNSRKFFLCVNGFAICAECGAHHWRIRFTVNLNPAARAPLIQLEPKK